MHKRLQYVLDMGGNVFEKRDKYSLLLASSLRRTAAVLALFVTLYAISAQMGYVARSQLYSPISSIVVATLTILSALWIYLNSKTRRPSTVRLFLIPFHALAVLTPLLITGFMSPLTVFWAILIAVTNILVSRKAMYYSAALLVATAYLNIMVLEQMTLIAVLSHLIYALIIIILSSFISALQAVQYVEHQDFVREKAEYSSQQNQLLTLINSVSEAILSVNAEGIVQLYNAAALNLLDTNQSLNGKHLDKVLNLFSDDGTPTRIFHELKVGNPVLQRTDLEHRFRNDEAINLAISSSRIRGADNSVQGYILILRDITRDKSLDEERDEFISVVSHELRTPVTITEGTISNVQMLIQKGAAPSVVAEALKAAYDQTIYLSRMINDLSTLSRAERGIGDEKETIDVTALMHDLTNEYTSKASAKHLKLNLDMSATLGHVYTSRLYLEEVLHNFLTNAVKYTEKGTITLSARRVRGAIRFSVRDTGIGISKHEQKKIFDKFYRAEDYRTRQTSGTGLGLYIVRKLAHKLGTTVEVESRLNHGSEFSFDIVIDRSDKAA